MRFESVGRTDLPCAQRRIAFRAAIALSDGLAECRFRPQRYFPIRHRNYLDAASRRETEAGQPVALQSDFRICFAPEEISGNFDLQGARFHVPLRTTRFNGARRGGVFRCLQMLDWRKQIGGFSTF